MKTINLEAERRTETEQINGVEFYVSVSPYLFPERLECDYLPDEGCLKIDFKYLDKEPSSPHQSPDGLVTLYLGEYTGKVLSVKVHVDRHSLDAVKMTVADELPKAINQIGSNRPSMTRHYGLAGHVLEQQSDEISNVVVGA